MSADPVSNRTDANAGSLAVAATSAASEFAWTRQRPAARRARFVSMGVHDPSGARKFSGCTEIRRVYEPSAFWYTSDVADAADAMRRLVAGSNRSRSPARPVVSGLVARSCGW